MSIFNFFKSSKNEECVKFSDQLQWVFYDCRYKHSDIFDDLITIYYDAYMGRPPVGWFLINKKFLVNYRCSYHTLESTYVDIYLVDNTFTVGKIIFVILK